MRSLNHTSARKTQIAPPPPEPTLEELLAEPIIRLVMARDGIQAEAIRLDLRRLGDTSPLARERA
jgi:hypothetical protein